MPGLTDLVIVGGGAAGLACAVAAGRLGIKAVVLEKTDGCGRKLALAGGRKGNFTHEEPPRQMADHFDCDPRLLVPLLRRFPYQRITGFFGTLGIRARVDEEGCIWPAGSDATGIRDALLAGIHKSGGEVVTGGGVAGLAPGWTAKLISGAEKRAANLCLATGGASYPHTGSTGDGVFLAAGLGLKTVPWFPALASLRTEEDFRGLAGATQPKVGMELRVDGNPVRQATGHFIFAHSHVSGSSVLNLCGFAARALAGGREVLLRVDWMPDFGPAELDALFAQWRTDHPKQMVVTFINRWMAKRLAHLLVKRAGVPPERVMAELTRAEQSTLAVVLKGTDLRIVGTEPIERATATGGGVSLEEVDMKTMQAARFPGLYFAGEVLDVWGETGGYNLHFAWASGVAVAEAIAGRQLD
jgi:predicted Rossmann fold flavoprotein